MAGTLKDYTLLPVFQRNKIKICFLKNFLKKDFYCFREFDFNCSNGNGKIKLDHKIYRFMGIAI